MKLLPLCIVINLLLAIVSHPSEAALTLNRSRVIYNEGDKAVSLSITNINQKDPYLAQGWMEDVNEKKISEPLMALPPVQRVEADGKSVVRIQALPDVAKLPKDRESVFYFNLREIPPKNEKANTLVLAMQTRLKVFFRPTALKVDLMANEVPGVRSLTLTRQGERYIIHNPTPYYFTFVEARPTPIQRSLDNFEPFMVAPKSSVELPLEIKTKAAQPVLIFINDYGAQRIISFHCAVDTCTASKAESAPKKTSLARASTIQFTDNDRDH